MCFPLLLRPLLPRAEMEVAMSTAALLRRTTCRLLLSRPTNNSFSNSSSSGRR